ncbi:hypothetical protein [Flavobacterium poyangense]|uniref:hypothetical protein n=1 Tax=Flavobacterium poyangense TaxID=2204302 RepID=UPI00141F1F8E|nr:hypothetical protein [Flavobacterium sp. JXAS1]
MKRENAIIAAFIFSVTILTISCETEKLAPDEQADQTKTFLSAKTWFKEYESNGKNYELVQNLNYDWQEAKLTKSEDGTPTIIVPVLELKKEERELWEQKLYIYKLDNNKYKALVFESYSNKNVKPESRSVDGGDFTGYITVWDLKRGPVRAAKFVDNRLVEEGVAEFSIARNKTAKAPPDPPCVYADFGDGGCGGLGNGDGPAIPLRPVIITGPGKGTPVVYNPRPVIPMPTSGGGTTPDGYTSPGGGGSGGGSSTNLIVIVGPAKVITNIKEYLKCFDLTKSAEIVIYVDQPKPNKPDAYTLTGDVGHTFIAIQQGNIRRVIGYWPATSVHPITSPSDTKAFGNDENHYFDVSISTSINPSQLANIINYTNNTVPKTYNLNTYNCTDFGIAVARLGGLNLNDSYGTWPGGGGSNPGQLGENIRNMATPVNGTKQTTGANSASNRGTCN